MGQEDILNLLNKKQGLTAREIMKNLNIGESSVNKSLIKLRTRKEIHFEKRKIKVGKRYGRIMYYFPMNIKKLKKSSSFK